MNENRPSMDLDESARYAELWAENQALKGSLRLVTDTLATLLEAGHFPLRGRNRDDREACDGWWEDSVAGVAKAYSVLAGEEDVLGWRLAHPGLYIPPPGPVRL